MKKPSIPEFPKTIEGLENLLNKKFKILWESDPVSATTGGEYHPGDIALTNVKKECPFCGMQFDAIRKRGCFGGSELPSACPNCNFPNNVFNVWINLMNLRKKAEKKK